MTTKNLTKEILKLAGNDLIEGVVFGRLPDDNHEWYDDDPNDKVVYNHRIPNYSDIPKGKLLPWNEAQKYTDFEYKVGLGTNGLLALHVWTTTKILSVCIYDGLMWLYALPRHPCNTIPKLVGRS